MGHQYEVPIMKEITGIFEIREEIPGTPNTRPNPINTTAIEIRTNGERSRLFRLIEQRAKMSAVVPK